MGLISGLLTLPLAPVRATAWVAEQLLAEAEQQLDPDTQLRTRLADLRMRYELEELTYDEYLLAENQAVADYQTSRRQRTSHTKEWSYGSHTGAES